MVSKVAENVELLSQFTLNHSWGAREQQCKGKDRQHSVHLHKIYEEDRIIHKAET